MRLLFVSNFYPPRARGGYEQWCHEVAAALGRRGHRVVSLTSRSPDCVRVEQLDGVEVHRALHLEVEGSLLRTIGRLLAGRQKREQANLDYVRSLCEEFDPDVALIWGMWNVPRSVPACIETLLPGRSVYYLCDYWLTLPNAYAQRWKEPARHKLAQVPKQAVGTAFQVWLKTESPVPLGLENPVCVSQAVKDLLVRAGVGIEHAQVIYGGTQIDEFANGADRRLASEPARLKLVYIGRLSPEKGVLTALKAVAQLATHYRNNVTLDIIGGGDPDYEKQLRNFVQQRQLYELITFKGRVPRADIPQIMATYDVLLFTSEWEEPFARTVLEAMAAGLLVIGTTTGGTGEILVNNETGLTFPATSAEKLAEQIEWLLTNPQQLKRLAKTGKQYVIEKFTFTRMVDEIEAYVQGMICGSSENASEILTEIPEAL